MTVLLRILLRSTVLLFTFSLLVLVGRVEASDGLRGGECEVTGNEIIQHDFYFFCNTLVIYGVVEGDVIGMASEVTIARQGYVSGDILMLGGHLTLEGTIEGDIRFMGADLDITNLVHLPENRTDVAAVAISVEVAEQVVIPGDLIFYGYQAILDGKITGNLDFQGQALAINNTISGRNVHAIVGDQESSAPLSNLFLYSVDFHDPGLRFGENGFIEGNLFYEAPQETSTRKYVAAGKRIQYKPSIASTSIVRVQESETFVQIVGNYIFTVARDVLSLGLIGILMLNFLPAVIVEPGYRVQTRTVQAFTWGLMLFFLSFPAALLLIVTSLILLAVVFIVTLNDMTIMFGIILLVINLGLIGGFWFLTAFLGRVIAAFVLGHFITRNLRFLWLRYREEAPDILGELWFATLVGVILISMLVHLPLGAFVNLVQLAVTAMVAFAGLGGLFMYIQDVWKWRIATPAVGLEMESPELPVRVPPPPPEDVDVPLGMENLPPGFNGFQD